MGRGNRRNAINSSIGAKLAPAQVAELESLRGLARALAQDPGTGDLGRALSSQTEEIAKALDIVTRRTEYMGEQARFNTQAQPWARPKPPDMLSHETCRAMVQFSPLAATIHRRREQACVQAFREWKGNRTHLGWRVVHVAHDDPNVDVDRVDGIRERIARAERMLRRPHPAFGRHLEEVGIPLIKDHLTLDRPVINLHWGATGKELQGFSHVDGATIMPVTQWLDQWLAHRRDRTGLDGSAQHRWEIGAEAALKELNVDVDRIRWVQVQRTGLQAPDAFLTDEDLIVATGSPSPNANQFGYGVSPLEANWVALTLYTFGVSWLGSYFKDALADTLLLVSGPGSQNSTGDLAAVLRTQHSGPEKHKYPLITVPQNGDIKPVFLRQNSAADMQFSEALHHLANLVAAGYQEDPSLVGLDPKGPSRNTIGGDSSRAQQIDAQRNVGERSTMQFLAERMFTPLVQYIDPDLKVIIQGLDEDNEKDVVELRTKKVASYLGVNQALAENDLPPIDDPALVIPGTKIKIFDLPAPFAQAAFGQVLQAAIQKKQMEEQQAQQAQQAQQQQQQGQGQDQPQGMPQSMQWQQGQGQDQGGQQEQPQQDDQQGGQQAPPPQAPQGQPAGGPAEGMKSFLESYGVV